MEIEAETKKNSLENMFKVGAHYGYSKSRRHPSVKSFIYGTKNRTEIIDLDQVYGLLLKAREFVSTLAVNGKQILFSGNKPEAKESVLSTAVALGMPYSKERWIGGTLTNFSEIKKRVARLEELKSKKQAGELNIYTKKERAILDKEIASLERFFDGLVKMKSLPAAIFLVDPKKESTAVREAKRMRLPIIALAGSDCDISQIEYPIVANDASRSSIKFFVDEIASAYREGKEKENGNNGSDQKSTG